MSALDGSNGFILNGIDPDDLAGVSVSSAGDVNGDGFDDVIIGASGADPNGIIDAGESYVVFGNNTGFPSSLDLSALDGSNGFILNGIDSNDFSGGFGSVSSAGDVNGDGFDDVIIGASGADPNGIIDAGESYVVFGNNTGFPSSLDLSALDGSNGFILNGIDPDDLAGSSVSSAGDVNGDGFDDVIIGASGADPNGIIDAGESYVVFGNNTGFPARLELSTLNGSNGFTLNGIDSEDGSLTLVSDAGDVNGDGFDDIIIGASEADLNGNNSVAESYVVFGFSGNISDDTLSGGESDEQISDRSGNDSIIIGTEFTDNLFGDSLDNTILGLEGDDQLSGDEGNDTINGNQGLDFILGGDGNDVLFGGQDFDFIRGEPGFFDTDFSNNNDLIFGNLGGDNLQGDEGNDTIYGGKDDDGIAGGLGNDLIFGDLGNDSIWGTNNLTVAFDPGTPQIDTLTGGPGADTFHLGSGFLTTYYTDHGNNDYALITDFNQSESDLIDFDFSVDFPAANNIVLENMTLPDVGMGTGVFVTRSGENEFVAFIQGIDANNLNLIEPVSGLVTIQ